MESRTVVVAVGGNSLITDPLHISPTDQFVAAKQTMAHVADMVAQGWNVVIAHGNGPQVGFMLRRAEVAAKELPTSPLDVLGADTQGATGYMFVRALHEELTARGVDRNAVAVVTQTVVDAADPAFDKPSKPIGSFLDKATADQRIAEDGWDMVEDSGRGWRRVVASPKPKSIVEIDAIRTLVDSGFLVVAGGGGGIPVIDEGNAYRGIEAVIDKDHASALIANELGADVLLISTAVDAVAVRFNTPDQEWLGEITADQAREYLAAGEFGAGSMAPKVEAAVDFLSRGGAKVIITSPARMPEALQGRAGTTIVP